MLEAFVEHTSVKRLLADLLRRDADDPKFEAQMKVLKEQVEHHVEEEEGQLFPAAKKVLSKEELVDPRPGDDRPCRPSWKRTSLATRSRRNWPGAQAAHGLQA